MNPFKSLISVIRFTTSLLFLILAMILSYLLAGEEYIDTQTQVKTIRTKFLSNQKERIQTRVQQTADYILHQKSLVKKRVHTKVKSRTLEAYGITDSIYKIYKDTHALPQIKTMVKDALSSASWDDQKGYYFVQNTKGILVFNRNSPNLEGEDISSVTDVRGTKIFKQFSQIAASPQKEGYFTYYWNKPGSADPQPKISFSKLFEPFGWIIASGIYLSDEEEKIKDEIIGQIEKISYGDSEYIFAGTYDGLSLSGPFKGQNIIDFVDFNGKEIIRHFIHIARQGGGFVEYVSPRYKGNKPSSKISYIVPIKGWNWYIGTGVHTDVIEKEIGIKKKHMKKKAHRLIIKCIGVLLLFWIFSYLAVGYLVRKIESNLELLSNFFKPSSDKALPIDTRQIIFSEFKSLAEFANQMSVERKKFEDELGKSEEKYKHLFNNTPAGVYEIDFKTNMFVTINDYLCKYLGYEREELLAESPLILLTEESQKKFLDRYELMLSKGKLNDYMEFDVIKKNEDVFTAVFRSEFIYKNNQAEGVRVVVTDISRIKEMEALMIQSEKMMSLGSLAVGMAHEINNPLAGITQNAQLIKSRLTQNLPANKTTADKLGISFETIKQYMKERHIFKLIENINKAGGKAAEIIENILSFANKSSAVKSERDIIDLIEKAIALAQNDFDLKTHHDFKLIKIVREYDPELPKIRCDAGKILQVLFNLLKNASESLTKKKAVDFSPCITLKVSSDPEMVHIRVQDNGLGMDASIQNRIFEPFYTTKAVDEGKGLGLSISYFIVVNDHGGTIEVDSETDKGTILTIGLPV